MYADLNYAYRYFTRLLYSDDWLNASTTDQQKALNGAEAVIDQLDFASTKKYADQTNECPRKCFTDQDMENIFKAQCEIAFSLIKGETADLLMDQLRVKDEQFSKAKVTYNNEETPTNLLAGVPSIIAWRYLAPYLKDTRGIRLSRVS